MELENKVALVTGGGSGIGRGICLKFAQEGARVFVNDLNLESAGAVAQEIKDAGGKAWAVKADVGSSGEVNDMVEFAMAEAGGIDILVNNAGLGGGRPIIEMKEAYWDRRINSNLKGTFLCTQAVARKMVEQGRRGRIINISSINSFIPLPGAAAYCAAKAGVIMLTKVAALELGGHGILVNAILPGPVATPATRPVFVDYEPGRKKFLEQMPIGRIGEPEDIAGVALFLATPASSFITGHALVADGGMSLIGEPNPITIMKEARGK